jgi:hypothetical protein
MEDLERSWRLYQRAALISALSQSFDTNVCRKAHIDFMELILRSHPKHVWLYVKHLRWMTSAEYAMLQINFLGTAPIYAAKTKALFAPGPEDGVVRGELVDSNGHFPLQLQL